MVACSPDARNKRIINPLYSDSLPIHINTRSMDVSILHIRGPRKNFLNYGVFLPFKIVLILVNSADPDEMQHYTAFYQGLHCLPKNPFRGFQYTKG